MAAMGMSEAERILIDELGENNRWDKYSANLARMKDTMSKTDWNASLANQWIETLTTLQSSDAKLPYFMKSPQWEKKNLNTALASWTEQKHDAILYAKQPMGAECGGYGPPDPVLKSYVEPNIAFWQKAITLLDNTKNILQSFNLETEKSITGTNALKEIADMLLNISKKELSGGTITDEEAQDRSFLEARLWKAIDSLPQRQREALLLCKRDGLSYRETAEKMGISEKTVEHLLSNAMKALRGHRADIYRIVLIFY